MPGKKWCEYCRINLPYDKKAIQEHQSTRMHIHNKQRHIKYERIKIMKQQKAEKQANKSNQLLSTANIPKAKKGSALQNEVNEYRNSVIMNGKMAIHQLIAEKTKGTYGAPIQYPDKEELVIAENYRNDNDQSQDEEDDGSSQNYEMWKIDVCQETGNPCFINRVTKMKLYQPPKGYALSNQQKQQWEQMKKICQQMPVQNVDQMGQIGLWEQVAPGQDYFALNRASESSESVQSQHPKVKTQKIEYQIKKQQIKLEQKPIKKSWMENLQQRINNNEADERQVFGSMVSNTLNECRNIKQKNQALKKLIKHDIEIHKNMDQMLEEELVKQEAPAKKGMGGLKPRKKIKTAQLTNEKDIV